MSRLKETEKAIRDNSPSFVDVGASCAPLRRRFDIDIREFMVLAVIYESGGATAQSLECVLELSSSTIDYCICRLAGNALIQVGSTLNGDIRATSDGLKLIREAFGHLAKYTPVPAGDRPGLECAA